MALKGDRVEVDTDISQTCESVAERGVFLCFKTAGSGVGIGATAGKSDLYLSPSGLRVAGLLANDVVNVDTTRYHWNFHKDETLVGNRVKLYTKGRFTTNKVIGAPVVGDVAYITTSGSVTPTMSATGGLVATPKVGIFKTIKDENGYATLDINLPIA